MSNYLNPNRSWTRRMTYNTLRWILARWHMKYREPGFFKHVIQPSNDWAEGN